MRAWSSALRCGSTTDWKLSPCHGAARRRGRWLGLLPPGTTGRGGGRSASGLPSAGSGVRSRPNSGGTMKLWSKELFPEPPPDELLALPDPPKPSGPSSHTAMLEQLPQRQQSSGSVRSSSTRSGPMGAICGGTTCGCPVGDGRPKGPGKPAAAAASAAMSLTTVLSRAFRASYLSVWFCNDRKDGGDPVAVLFMRYACSVCCSIAVSKSRFAASAASASLSASSATTTRRDSVSARPGTATSSQST
mmetsp:Transcript_14368/g.45231  ORF Transcript_14368/g.45231 Transcript_14368/m.45231 type:complete len:247 (-) Transcript_14368:813-1553(-)